MHYRDTRAYLDYSHHRTSPHHAEKHHPDGGDQYHDRNQGGDRKEQGGEGICERVERLMMVSRPEKRPANVSGERLLFR